MTAMTFVQAVEIITRNYTDKASVRREFDVYNGGIHSEKIAYGTRTRRFLIERVIITWGTSRGGTDYRSISVTGRTLLANGEVSTRSTGHASYWREAPPGDIATFADSMAAEVEALRAGRLTPIAGRAS